MHRVARQNHLLAKKTWQPTTWVLITRCGSLLGEVPLYMGHKPTQQDITWGCNEEKKSRFIKQKQSVVTHKTIQPTDSRGDLAGSLAPDASKPVGSSRVTARLALPDVTPASNSPDNLTPHRGGTAAPGETLPRGWNTITDTRRAMAVATATIS